MTRRELLNTFGTAASGLFVLGLLPANGCTRHRYDRPAEEIDLGPIEQLLYRQVHLRKQSVLVLRDIDGWSVLSAQCTYIGCDLTYQYDPGYHTQVLLCPCCKARFDAETGRPFPGWPATVPLPWFEVHSNRKDGHLYVNTGKVVPASQRFTTKEIEDAIYKLRKRVKVEGLGDETKIPEALLGQGDGEPGRQFIDENPFLNDELNMVK